MDPDQAQSVLEGIVLISCFESYNSTSKHSILGSNSSIGLSERSLENTNFNYYCGGLMIQILACTIMDLEKIIRNYNPNVRPLNI